MATALVTIVKVSRAGGASAPPGSDAYAAAFAEGERLTLAEATAVAERVGVTGR